MFRLGQFLNVAGSGERVKIGLRSKRGFRFNDLVINLYDNKEVQAIYDYPVCNIYTGDSPTVPFMVVILDDMGDK
jgi:hypothetical protein